MAAKFLKTNDPAKSPDFAPNDFNDLLRGRETAGFAQRNDSFRFHVFPAGLSNPLREARLLGARPKGEKAAEDRRVENGAASS